MNGIIRTSNLIDVAPAMLAHPGARPKPIEEASMFNILPKKCSSCGEWKSRGEFYKSKRYKDGLRTRCKSCEYEAELRYRSENPGARSKTNKKYYTTNHEQELARAKKYREENPEKHRASYLNWKHNHLEERLEHERNRIARKKGNGGSVTVDEWRALKEKYSYRCLCCGKCEPEIKLEMDHVKPLVLGGENTIENAQPLCRSCNARKSGKWIDYR